MDVSVRHFARFGFRKTSLTEIATELGVVKGALYYYFPGGKSELFDATSVRIETEILARIECAVAAEKDARHALRALFATKYREIRTQLQKLAVTPSIARELVAERQRSRGFRDAECELIQRTLAQGERERVFRRFRPRAAAAAAVQAMFDAPLVEAALAAAPDDDDTLPLHAVFFDILIDGLSSGKVPPRSSH